MTFWYAFDSCARYALAASGGQEPLTSWRGILAQLEGPRFTRLRQQLSSLYPLDEATLRDLAPMLRPETAARLLQMSGGHLVLTPAASSAGLRIEIRSAAGADVLSKLTAEEAAAVHALSVNLHDDATPAVVTTVWLGFHRAFAHLRALEITSAGDVGGELFDSVPRDVEELALYTAPWTDNAYAALGQLSKLRALTVMHRKLDLTKLPPMPGLEALILENVGAIDKAALDALLKRTSLRRVHLRGCGLGKEAARLSELSELVELDLGHNAIDDATGAKLAKLRGLRVLGLSNTKVGRKTSTAVAASMSLQEVDLEQTDKVSIATVAESKSLLSLRMTGISYQPEELRALEQTRTLRFLVAFGTHPGLFALASALPNLQALHIRGGVVGPVAGPLRLSEVDVSRTDAREEQLAAIAQPALRAAAVARVPISDAFLKKTAPHLQNLEHLNLTGNGFSDAGFQALGSLPALSTLFSIGNTIDVRGARALAHAPRLRWLSLQVAEIDGEKLRILAATPSLQRLHASVTDLDDATLRGLKSATQLRELHIERHACSQQAVADLRGALPACLIRV